MNKVLTLPLLDDSLLNNITAGEMIYINGILYTARDQAHKLLIQMINQKKNLPFNPKGNVIYYCGPTPSRENGLFGSAGPTTSTRMDEYTIPLLEKGLKGFIGKGNRSDKIRNACQKYKALYFISFGGAGAYLAKRIINQKLIAFNELGTEAIYQLEVQNFPVIAAYDVFGKTIFE